MDEEEFFGAGIGNSVFGGQIEVQSGDPDFYDPSLDEIEESYSPSIPPGTYAPAKQAAAGLGQAPVAISGVGDASQNPDAALGAAITIFMLVSGGIGGYYLGGLQGAAGGVFTAGGVRNMWQIKNSTETVGKVTRGLIGLAGLAGGGYLLFTANKNKESK